MQSKVVLIFGIFLLWLNAPLSIPSAYPSSDESPTLDKEIQALKKGQKEIQQALREIRGLLTLRNKRPKSIEEISYSLNVGDSPRIGNEQASLTLVEFTDYQCPFCARHSQNVLPTLIKDFINEGTIRYIIKDFPLDNIHPQAAKAHEAAHCAGEQGQYWTMHDQLFAHQKQFEESQLVGHAKEAGVADISAFKSCLEKGKFKIKTQAGFSDGKTMGVKGTPSFVLGHTENDGNVKAVKLIRGAQPFSVFEKQINSVLDQSKKERGSAPGKKEE